MSLQLITGPTVEPVTLAEAKAQMRKQDSVEDSLITDKIAAAREEIEQYLDRALISQTWELSLDGFFDQNGCLLEAIELPKARLLSVTSIAYTAADGTTAAMSPGDYVADTADDNVPGWVIPKYGTSWPETHPSANSVRIRFVAGYGPTAANPSSTARGCGQLLLSLHGWRFTQEVLPL
jgi:uncharacterized phiE125 gp8 family phage protein